MKRIVIILLVCMTGTALQAQITPKLNGLYAVAGVINPAVEFPLSAKYTFQSEIVYSPWLGVRKDGQFKPLYFGIFMNEVRRYFKERNNGWYVGINGSMMGFKMSKPYIENWKLKVESEVGKGYGIMVGVCAGYEFQLGEKWLLDVYLGWARMWSWYNRYLANGEIDMYPHRPVQPDPPDPFNGSAEWYPNKIGVSVGYRF